MHVTRLVAFRHTYKCVTWLMVLQHYHDNVIIVGTENVMKMMKSRRVGLEAYLGK